MDKQKAQRTSLLISSLFGSVLFSIITFIIYLVLFFWFINFSTYWTTAGVFALMVILYYYPVYRMLKKHQSKQP